MKGSGDELNDGICGHEQCGEGLVSHYAPCEAAHRVGLCQKHMDWVLDWDTQKQRKKKLKAIGYGKKITELCCEVAPQPKPKDERSMATKKDKKSKGIKKGKKSKAPAPKKEAGAKRGSVESAWEELFVTNEKAKKGDRLTDKAIRKAMCKLFPNRDAKVFTEDAEKMVALVRRNRNRGCFHKGVVPKTQSKAYDKNGDALPAPKRGRKAQPAAVTVKPKGKSKGIRKAKK